MRVLPHYSFSSSLLKMNVTTAHSTNRMTATTATSSFLRDSSSKNNAGFTVQQAAIDFSIPEATVTSLLAIARSPTIKRDIESAELAIAE